MPRKQPDSSVPRLLLDALRPIQRELNAQRTVSTGKLGILRHLVDGDRATTTELAARIRVSPQAVSLATRELESLGLIARTQDAEDRRRAWFVLTDAGRARYDAELLTGVDWLAKAIDQRLTADEAQRLADAIPALAKLTAEDLDA
ncbi:MarR family winged helix-turn-helix transcriptional regulator [Nocardioides alcanivorans]|uniref:MarR family winged helix-turn-helix transcriptional regulator n=1 Tax=Nocardioides alcanivorans TaxID=2897352 RepID=UPI001F2FEFCE|nr:MarR family transcriptional regulator [Nocardioides alcanivorans]